MVEKRDELNTKYYYGSREARIHLELCIVPVPSFSLYYSRLAFANHVFTTTYT